MVKEKRNKSDSVPDRMLSRVNLFKEETRVREQEIRQKWPETRQLQGVPQVRSGWRRHRGDTGGGGGREGTQGFHSEILSKLSVIPLRLRSQGRKRESESRQVSG